MLLGHRHCQQTFQAEPNPALIGHSNHNYGGLPSQHSAIQKQKKGKGGKGEARSTKKDSAEKQAAGGFPYVPGQSHRHNFSEMFSVWKCFVRPGVGATGVFFRPNSALIVELLPTFGYPTKPTTRRPSVPSLGRAAVPPDWGHNTTGLVYLILALLGVVFCLLI